MWKFLANWKTISIWIRLPAVLPWRLQLIRKSLIFVGGIYFYCCLNNKLIHTQLRNAVVFMCYCCRVTYVLSNLYQPLQSFKLMWHNFAVAKLTLNFTFLKNAYYALYDFCFHIHNSNLVIGYRVFIQTMKRAVKGVPAELNRK